jgi:hypothetical protein
MFKWQPAGHELLWAMSELLDTQVNQWLYILEDIDYKRDEEGATGRREVRKLWRGVRRGDNTKRKQNK